MEQEKIAQYILDKNSKPTEDQEKRLKKLKDSEICYDEDCPRLSREDLENFEKMEKMR